MIVLALWSLAVASCAGATIDDPTTTPDAGLAVNVAPCNDLANDAPVTHPSCACTGCPQSGTPAIANGTFVMKTLVDYTDDCTTLSATNVRGKMRVDGNTMDVVIEQPGTAIGDTVVTRMRYIYQLSNGVLQLQWTCPATDGGMPSQVVTYASDGRSMRFASLPGTHGDTVFAP